MYWIGFFLFFIFYPQQLFHRIASQPKYNTQKLILFSLKKRKKLHRTFCLPFLVLASISFLPWLLLLLLLYKLSTLLLVLLQFLEEKHNKRNLMAWENKRCMISVLIFFCIRVRRYILIFSSHQKSYNDFQRKIYKNTLFFAFAKGNWNTILWKSEFKCENRTETYVDWKGNMNEWSC